MQALLTHPLVRSLTSLFEHLPEVYFFVKDEKSRFVHASTALLQRLGLPDQADIVDTTDHDRYPHEIAEQLVAGDREVLTSREPIIDRLEVLFSEVGTLEWFSTTKYPVFDENEQPLGVVGFARSITSPGSPYQIDNAATRVIELVSCDPATPHSVDDLAKQVGISPRQLHRQFIEGIHLSPSEFVLRTRIHAAAAELRRRKRSVAEISDHYGFCDQSAFTRQFKKIIGMPPARYRRQK